MNGGTPCAAGVSFGPTPNGKHYISLYIHRGHRPARSKWSIAPVDEFAIFGLADAGDWYAVPGHYWGVSGPQANTIGQAGERVCKFPFNQNAQLPWHGYPVSLQDDRRNDSPPDILIYKWMILGVVSRTIGNKILRGRI